MTSAVARLRELVPADDPKRTISRTGFGLGVGAFFGFLFGGMSGAGIGALAGGGIAAMSDPDITKGQLTGERQEVYERAMASADADKLEALAAKFEKEDLRAHAEVLRRKAKARRLTPEQAANKARVFVRALCSSKIEAIERLAARYRDEGAFMAAKSLDGHVADLKALAAGKRSDELTAAFEKKLTCAREQGADAEWIASAEKNLADAREKPAAT